MREQVAQARAILDGAIREHRPAYVFALLSGGYDSLAMTWLASQHPQFSGVVHIRTGTGIPETSKFVRRFCRQYDLPLFVYRPPDYYEDYVARYGTPGPAEHPKMYQRLKERCINMVQKDFTRPAGTPIMYVSGIRKQESKKRMGYLSPVTRGQYADGRPRMTVWVNPLFYWSAEDVTRYRYAARLPKNEVKDRCHISGECLCGCMADEDEMAVIDTWYPWTGRRLRRYCQTNEQNGFPWRWGEKQPAWYRKVKRGQRMHEAFMPLCSSCEARG